MPRTPSAITPSQMRQQRSRATPVTARNQEKKPQARVTPTRRPRTPSTSSKAPQGRGFRPYRTSPTPESSWTPTDNDNAHASLTWIAVITVLTLLVASLAYSLFIAPHSFESHEALITALTERAYYALQVQSAKALLFNTTSYLTRSQLRIILAYGPLFYLRARVT